MPLLNGFVNVSSSVYLAVSSLELESALDREMAASSAA
jgi:hypothetical protein